VKFGNKGFKEWRGREHLSTQPSCGECHSCASKIFKDGEKERKFFWKEGGQVSMNRYKLRTLLVSPKEQN
jgi:hypothetical protein